MLRLNMEIKSLDPFQAVRDLRLKHYCGFVGWERTIPINGAYMDEVISIWLLPETKKRYPIIKLSEVLHHIP